MVETVFEKSKPIFEACSRFLLLKDIKSLERIQRGATKFILGDYNSDYKCHLLSLNLFPLMYIYSKDEWHFLFLKELEISTKLSFDILNYVSFCPNSTCSSTSNKLVRVQSSTNAPKFFYFNWLPHLWNTLSPIDLSNSFHSIYQNSGQTSPLAPLHWLLRPAESTYFSVSLSLF